MNVKVIGGIILAIILIVVIIVLVVYRKSFFSKKTSESTTDNNEKESSTDSGVKEVEAPTVTEEESGYDESDFEEENITGGGGTNYEVDEQEEEQEEYETEMEDVDFETEMEDVDFDTEMEDVDYETEMEGPTPINSETSSEVIDNLLEKEGWEISTDISISDTSGQWRNLFHYGNNNGTRAPAMWIYKNQHWKLHFRIKTTSNSNDGLDFDVPEEFRNPGQTFNVRIRHEGYDNYSKISVYVNDVLVKKQNIGLFTPVKNQQFDFKKSWGDEYTDKENYTISNFTLREFPRTWEEEPIIMEVTEQECADAGGTNYYKCPETGITYCCGLCDNRNMVSCPSSNGCRDRRGDVDEETGKSEECQTHKNNGGCSSANSNHFNWRSECVKTCGYCDDERYNVPGRCACIGELTKENSDVIGYALRYSDLYRAFQFDEEQLWNHWVNNGKNEKRIMNPLLPMDDLYNQEGFPAHPMPTNPAWGQLKNDDGNVIFEDGWIWHLPMPNRTEIPNGTESMMMTVPIDTCRFYRDYNNDLGIEHPVKLYVNVDDYAYVIHNNKYIIKVIEQDNPGIDLVLTPGKNRIMIVACNTGGPAGLQAAMMDDVNDAPLISTAVQSSWRYINDMYYTADMNYNLVSHGDWNGAAKLKTNIVDVEGRHTFHYCYNNTSGTVINGQINSRCDDFVVIWHERKLLLAKGMNDPEACFVKIRPGKNVFAFCVSNYAGPGWIAAKCFNRANNSLLWKTTTNGGWYYKFTNFYPGPAEFYTTYRDTGFNGRKKGFRYGVWDKDRMVAKGVPNNSISSAKVPRGMQVKNYQDENNWPNGWNQTLWANSQHDYFNHFNDRISAFVVQTPQYNRALFFEESYYRNEFRFTNSYSTNNAGLKHGTNYHKPVMEENGVSEDRVWDLIIPKGIKVTIQEHNGHGRKVSFGPYNNRIQSKHHTNENDKNMRRKNSRINVEANTGWGYTDYQVFNDNLLGAGNVEKFLSQ